MAIDWVKVDGTPLVPQNGVIGNFTVVAENPTLGEVRHGSNVAWHHTYANVA